MKIKKVFQMHHEFEFRVNVTCFTPERPAPNCQDHDSPRFSDSGDDEELEFTLLMKKENGEYVEVTDDSVSETVYEKIAMIMREEEQYADV